MKKTIVVIFLSMLFIGAGQLCMGDDCKGERADKETKTCEEKPLDIVLKKLQTHTTRLKSYQADVKYLVIQDPELLDSRTLRKGRLYYIKEKKRSKLRINFATIKQDDDREQKQRQEFIFDGVWLTTIDYQLENVNLEQLAEENKALDVFEFISRNFPLVGFTKTDQLRKQFEINMIEPNQDDPNSVNLIHLHLKTKKDSIYKDKYKKVDFWIDKKIFLPTRIAASSTEGDIYDIQFLKPRVNKKIKKSIFKVDSPRNFDINRLPLEK